MNGFLDQAELTGKTVYLLTVQADSGHSRSDEVLEHYSRPPWRGGPQRGSGAVAARDYRGRFEKAPALMTSEYPAARRRETATRDREPDAQ